jgi:DNA-binding NarL/FixJ family response regulator
MNAYGHLVFITQDPGLQHHWKSTFSTSTHTVLTQLLALPGHALPNNTTVWIDTNIPQLPQWSDGFWQAQLLRHRTVCSSSNPKDADAIAALDAGCSAYCHAFATSETLRQVQEVVASGQIWVGRDLMQQLLASANRAVNQRPATSDTWSSALTAREKEIAVLVAKGASNKVIASDCSISERTVKAHLAAIFEKMGLTDRLQLALRVHGIR